jgi:hypothetical protein
MYKNSWKTEQCDDRVQMCLLIPIVLSLDLQLHSNYNQCNAFWAVLAIPPIDGKQDGTRTS